MEVLIHLSLAFLSALGILACLGAFDTYMDRNFSRNERILLACSTVVVWVYLWIYELDFHYFNKSSSVEIIYLQNCTSVGLPITNPLHFWLMNSSF